MNAYERYKYWVENEYFDEETRVELRAIQDNRNEIEERFYKELEFGTGGLRGIIGAGTNRINKYTVRKASQAFANYILKRKEKGKSISTSVVIAFDSRSRSSEFAFEAAAVFAGNGIKAFVFDELRPVPELSFAVRYLKAAGGVVITASHNPKEYNGYKAYGDDGAQLSLQESESVIKEAKKLTDITDVNTLDIGEAQERGLISIIDENIDNEYIASLKALSINCKTMKNAVDSLIIVYTPLHGAGNKPVQRVLSEVGFKKFYVVQEQKFPDPLFSTVKFPNPESEEAFEMAIKLGRERKADILIATDPDADRMGLMVKGENGNYVGLTGNQIGCLLLEYILSQKSHRGELPANGFVVTTIVSTDMARAISKQYKIELFEVLTGFKFIGEKIKEIDECGNRQFLFGFEESYGYLPGTYARDKDAVATSMFAAEMACYFKAKGKTLYQALMEMFKKYGYFIEDTVSFNVEGKEGQERIVNAMNKLRQLKPIEFGGYKVSGIRDYLESIRYDMITKNSNKLELPSSNVLYYEIEGESWFCIRPSGTEPKIKVYFGVSGSSKKASQEKLDKIKGQVLDEIKRYLQMQ